MLSLTRSASIRRLGSLCRFSTVASTDTGELGGGIGGGKIALVSAAIAGSGLLGFALLDGGYLEGNLEGKIVSIGEHTGSKARFILGDDFRRKVFFNYEKRIRMCSPPEKVEITMGAGLAG